MGYGRRYGAIRILNGTGAQASHKPVLTCSGSRKARTSMPAFSAKGKMDGTVGK
jgi:hypothetical protein